jgi:hypothetical protein
MFGSSAGHGLVAMMCFQRSNIMGAETEKEGLWKHDLTNEQQNSILLEYPTSLYATKTSLQEIKQVLSNTMQRSYIERESQEKGKG